MSFAKKEEIDQQEISDKLEKLTEKVIDDLISNPSYNSILLSAHSGTNEIKKKARDQLVGIIKSNIHDHKKDSDLDIKFKFNESELVKEIEEDLWGLSRVTPLVEDVDITDVRITSSKKVLFKKDNVEYLSDIKFRSAKELRRFMRNICVRNRVNISDIGAQKIFVDKESNAKFNLRIAVSADLVMCDREPFIHIRKHPKKKRSWKELENNKVITPQQRKFLSNVMYNKESMIIGGAPGSRKTTLLNNLIDELPIYTFGECYQAADELHSDIRPGIAFKSVILPSVDSKVSYSLEDFAIHGLTSGTDVMIISEVKDREAMYILKAIYTGVATYLTIHATSAEEILDNLVTYILIATGFPIKHIKRMLLGFKYIVYMQDVKVASILRLKGLDEQDNFVYEKVNVELEVA